MSSNGWVGFDLDGTLAHYDGWVSDSHIGEPIEPMVKLVQKYLRAGRVVKIFTARATDPTTIPRIKKWCKTHIGQELDVTCSKDYQMILLYDDRCVQVVTNTGRIVK